jgi:hypothetical protein
MYNRKTRKETRKIALPLKTDITLRQTELLGALEVLDVDYACLLISAFSPHNRAPANVRAVAIFRPE